MSGERDTKINRAMTTLGYDSRWLQYGILDEPFLAQQLAEYEVGEDQNTEHYRCRSFFQLLEESESLDDATVDGYVELAGKDPDKQMGLAALLLLATWTGLTKRQLERLHNNSSFNTPEVQELLAKKKVKQWKGRR